MQYNILINQIQCQKYGLNMSLGTLMYMFTKLSTRATDHIVENGEVYYRLTAGKIVQEVPLISAKKNTILIYIKKLVEKGLVERIIKGNTSYYKLSALGKEFDTGVENNQESVDYNQESVENNQESVENNQEGCGLKSREGVENNQDNQYTNNNNTNDKEKINKKENSNDGTTDLSRIKIEKIMEVWNSFKEKDSNWKKTIVINKELVNIWKEIIKEYTKEQFNIGLGNYLEEIKKRKNDGSGYYKHRFTLYQFLKQKNGLNKFVNF